MNEWIVVEVIIALVGLGVLIIKPFISLTGTLKELIMTCKTLTDAFSKFETGNIESHRKIWEHEEKQDTEIQNHELRISKIEQREE